MTRHQRWTIGRIVHLSVLGIGIVIALGTFDSPIDGQAPAQAPSDGALPMPARPAPVANKAWSPARLPDGQPDVPEGVWGAVGPTTHNPLENPTGRGVAPSRIADPPDGRVPYQPWAAAKRKQQAFDRDNATKPEHVDSQQRCLYAPPRMAYGTERYRLIQIPGHVIFVWDRNHEYRVVPVTPAAYANPSPKLKTWMGFPRGRWEGNTLVIESTNHRGIRLTSLGDFITAKTRFTERYMFVDADTINWEVTIEDPSVFTRPWTMRVLHKIRVPAAESSATPSKTDEREEFWEEACWEGVSEVEATLFSNIVTK